MDVVACAELLAEVDLASDPAYAGHRAALLSALAEANRTLYTPHRGKQSQQACAYALGKHKGYWGPFVP